MPQSVDVTSNSSDLASPNYPYAHENLPVLASVTSRRHLIVGMPVVRKWQIFPGRNRFFCNGRLMMGRQAGVFYFTVVLIVGTMALFFGFDAVYLSENLSPILPVVAGILTLFVLSCLFRTSFSDPGIIPRALTQEAMETERQITQESPQGQDPQYRPPPRMKEIVIKGQTVKLKYCFTCKIFRPPRASHCSVCDNCVELFDHHCPWVGNCVGRRNYRYFYLFLVSLSFLCVYVFACVVAHIILLSKQTTFLLSIQKTPASLVVALICFFSVWSVLGLAGFHTFLITANQTTNEDIKGTFSSKRSPSAVNPFSRGSVTSNFTMTLCGPQFPSLIDRRGLAQSEEVCVPMMNVTCSPSPGPNEINLAYGSVDNRQVRLEQSRVADEFRNRPHNHEGVAG